MDRRRKRAVRQSACSARNERTNGFRAGDVSTDTRFQLKHAEWRLCMTHLVIAVELQECLLCVRLPETSKLETQCGNLAALTTRRVFLKKNCARPTRCNNYAVCCPGTVIEYGDSLTWLHRRLVTINYIFTLDLNRKWVVF
jgi:hypothetical protein